MLEFDLVWLCYNVEYQIFKSVAESTLIKSPRLFKSPRSLVHGHILYIMYHAVVSHSSNPWLSMQIIIQDILYFLNTSTTFWEQMIWMTLLVHVNPFPANPVLQLHWNDPTVFWQSALVAHGFAKHSLISIFY